MSKEISADQPAPNVAAFSAFLDKFKPQITLALPRHMNADRMTRLALTSFSTNEDLQLCTPRSIAASIMTAATLGLEPGVNGQGYLIPYRGQCTFVPGWKGLVDIANRSGRSTVWTGAVFDGDKFDFALGDSPFVRHQPGDEDHPDALTHVYAIGRSTGGQWPVIEVWTVNKVLKHRQQFNKVGDKHYSYKNWEMYARKVPLLQVLKYMPSSIELANAITASSAAELGRQVLIDGDIITFNESTDSGDTADKGNGQKTLPAMSDDDFAKELEGWKRLIESGKKKVNDLIAVIETTAILSTDQKVTLAAFGVKPS